VDCAADAFAVAEPGNPRGGAGAADPDETGGRGRIRRGHGNGGRTCMGAGVVGARAGLTGPGLTNSQPPFPTLPSPPAAARSLLCPVQRGDLVASAANGRSEEVVDNARGEGA
jgi:hypothetical protein